jgi:hypothetical protein
MVWTSMVQGHELNNLNISLRASEAASIMSNKGEGVEISGESINVATESVSAGGESRKCGTLGASCSVVNRRRY